MRLSPQLATTRVLLGSAAAHDQTDPPTHDGTLSGDGSVADP